MELTGNENSKSVYQLLGFPMYLMPFIGIARILALTVIWWPGFKRLKEWAFAGLCIDVVGAGYCLVMATGDIHMIWVPLIAFIFVLGTYYYYHKVGSPIAKC